MSPLCGMRIKRFFGCLCFDQEDECTQKTCNTDLTDFNAVACRDSTSSVPGAVQATLGYLRKGSTRSTNKKHDITQRPCFAKTETDRSPQSVRCEYIGEHGKPNRRQTQSAKINISRLVNSTLGPSSDPSVQPKNFMASVIKTQICMDRLMEGHCTEPAQRASHLFREGPHSECECLRKRCVAEFISSIH